jgi:hypothetical protein
LRHAMPGVDASLSSTELTKSSIELTKIFFQSVCSHWRSVLLILFIFAILGMQLFGNTFAPPQFIESPRANFDSTIFSFLTVFIVATGEVCSLPPKTTSHTPNPKADPLESLVATNQTLT